MTTPLRLKKPLPQCEGPKLAPLQKKRAKIEFVSLLSDVEADGHAHVFEALIDSKEYALKVFKFYDDEEDLAALDDEDRAYVPIDLLHAHMDPFYNECRAYGRLIEKKINGKVAAQCYGYIAVPAARKSELAQRFDVDEAQWGQPDNAPLLRNKTPLRAIAKQLIREDKPLSEKLAAKMLRDLKRMRRAGVYPMDIRKRNYKGGLLLDMSIAMVKPHYVFDIRPEWHVERLQNADLKGFQRMVDKAGGKTWKRAVRNPEYCVKLRSSGIDPLVP